MLFVPVMDITQLLGVVQREVPVDYPVPYKAERINNNSNIDNELVPISSTDRR